MTWNDAIIFFCIHKVAFSESMTESNLCLLFLPVRLSIFHQFKFQMKKFHYLEFEWQRFDNVYKMYRNITLNNAHHFSYLYECNY